MIIELYYDQIHVGDISDPFCDQGTWCGDFQERVDPMASPLHARLHEFVRFSEQWHSELAGGTGGDAAAFDQFGDLLASQLWHTGQADGIPRRIEGAPSFSAGEISWVAPERQTIAKSAERG